MAGDALISPQSLRLATNGKIRLSAVIFDVEGKPISVPDLDWKYDDALFTVDGRNRLTTQAAPGHYDNALSLIITGPDGTPKVVTKSITVLGTLTRIEITPKRATLAAGDPVLFSAQAFDEANNLLRDVGFRWSTVDGGTGSITAGGLYVAADDSGLHIGVVKVKASQRVTD
jgi:hypothetical protein